MLVEFIGGSLDSQQKIIERFFEYFYTNKEFYYARAFQYQKLGWTYVWYELAGNFQNEIHNETVNG